VLDHTLEQGNPADASSSLLPSNESSPAPGAVPEPVTADRGYGEKGIDEALHQMGVRTVVIPRKGRPGKDRRAAEHRPVFRRTVKCADRQRRPDQHPQTRLRMGPDRMDSTEGATIWTGHGILAHNLVKIGALAS
jgi:transposase, IS5 family